MNVLKAGQSKNIFIIAGLVAASCVALAAYSVLRNDNNTTGEVVAQINGKPVYFSEVEEQMNLMLKDAQKTGFDKLNEKSKLFVVTELAAQKLILEEAYSAGLENDKAVTQRVNAYRDEVVKEEFLTQKAKNIVTDEKIKERYNKDVAALEGKTQYRASHIVVKTEAEANEVKNALRSKSFAAVANERSIDGRTANKGGDLGYLISGIMLPDIENALSKMKSGEVSNPVKTQFGWHIVKLEEKKAAAPAPYEKVKDLLAQALYQEEIKTFVDDLMASTKIEIVANKTDASDSIAKDSEVKDSEVKDSEVKDSEVKDSEVKDSEVKDSEVKDSETKSESTGLEG